MASFRVIWEVGDALSSGLFQALSTDPDTKDQFTSLKHVSLKSPADAEDDADMRLSLYLYRVAEDATSKNRPPVSGSGSSLRKAPLALDLHYLITPLLKEPKDQQLVLGKVMQVLYDQTTLSPASLGPNDEPLRLTLNPVSLEETTRVWQALEVSYRLSLCYIIRVANIDSTVEVGGPPVFSRATAGPPAS